MRLAGALDRPCCREDRVRPGCTARTCGSSGQEGDIRRVAPDPTHSGRYWPSRRRHRTECPVQGSRVKVRPGPDVGNTRGFRDAHYPLVAARIRPRRTTCADRGCRDRGRRGGARAPGHGCTTRSCSSSSTSPPAATPTTRRRASSCASRPAPRPSCARTCEGTPRGGEGTLVERLRGVIDDEQLLARHEIRLVFGEVDGTVEGPRRRASSPPPARRSRTSASTPARARSSCPATSSWASRTVVVQDDGVGFDPAQHRARGRAAREHRRPHGALPAGAPRSSTAARAAGPA